MIKAVLFDYGGVLSEGGKKGCIPKIFAKIYGIDVSETNPDCDLTLMVRCGEITEQEYFAEMNRRHPNGPRATPENYLAAADILMRSEPVFELAASLREQGIMTGILSNINGTIAEELRKRGEYDDFDPLILSYELGLAKPDPELYTLAVDRTGFKANEVLLIDDMEMCRPPAEINMHFILATSPQQIVDDTKALFLRENGLLIGNPQTERELYEDPLHWRRDGRAGSAHSREHLAGVEAHA